MRKDRCRKLKTSQIWAAAGLAGFLLAAALHLTGPKILIGTALIAAFALLAVAATTSKRFKNIAFSVWIFAFAAAAFCYPHLFITWRGFHLQKTITPLVQLILFGMGMTLTFQDFARVFKMPTGVFIGFVLQYTVMPVMGYTFASAFGLPPHVAVGLILVGSCPGGVASNVITYIAGANVALSVTMTACSTLLSPLMTPLAMKLLAGQYIQIDALGMMLTIFKMIILPLLAGLLINLYAKRLAQRLVRILPTLAMLSICIIIAITIAMSRNDILEIGAALLGASACHSVAGFTLGYCGARLLGRNQTDSRTIAIEVGMQNGGMATGLALDVFDSKLVAIASAVFGPFNAAFGSVLASVWRAKAPNKNSSNHK